MKSFSIIPFVISIIIIFFQSCNNPTQTDKDNKKLKNYSPYLLTLTGVNNGEAAAKLFYINPALKIGSNLNLDLVVEASRDNIILGRKKLILVHGWDYNDKDTSSFTLQQQRDRIVTNGWSDFIRSPTFDMIVLSKFYDIYAYDYLTSNPIDTNGIRFRSKMDLLFGNEVENIVILSYSMGGLISRFAIYEGAKPTYINRVITLGTPFHGSPWASPQFQSDKGTLGNIATFLTNTDGGKDLAWDNFDMKISGAVNTKLTTINAKTDRDLLFYAYYGSVNASGNTAAGATSPGLSLACTVLGSSFAPSDCIVPSTSANLSGNTLKMIRDIGAFDHFDIKLLTSAMQSTLNSDLP